MTNAEIRQQRQQKLEAAVSRLRAQADAKEAQAESIDGSRITDGAFWTQPAYGSAAGRAFAARRDRERNRMFRAGELYSQAKELRQKADAIKSAGVRVKGDADASRQEAIQSADFSVGDRVRTLYGIHPVVKVNAKTVRIDTGSSKITICKSLVGAA